MTVRVFAQTSGVTAEDLRLAFGAAYAQAAVLNARSGVIPAGGAPGDLVSVAALQAKVTPLQAIVDGTSGFFQGGYLVTSDSDVTLTFGAGSGSNPRVDLVVLRVRDDPYDASASQVGSVEIVTGTPAGSPVAPPVPASSLALWQVLVPANASGAIPIVFSTARTDRRVWTTGVGGTLPVANTTERNAIVGPYAGLGVYRKDSGTTERYNGSVWVVESAPTAPNMVVYGASGSLAANTYPYAKALRMRVWGGGGAGGSSSTVVSGDSSAGAGGGGGGYAEALLPVSSLSFPLVITIGAAGAIAVAGGTGGAGGTSAVTGANGSLYARATGGAGGGGGNAGDVVGQGARGGAGGVGNAGQIQRSGTAGVNAYRVGTSLAIAGNGGAGACGGGGGLGGYSLGEIGDDGGAYGGGGGGGRSGSPGPALRGGYGGQGIVTIEAVY